MSWKPIVIFALLICAVVSTCILQNDAEPYELLLRRCSDGRPMMFRLTEAQVNELRMNILRDHFLIALSWLPFAASIVAFALLPTVSLLKKRGKALLEPLS